MSAWLIRQYRGIRIWLAVRFNRPLNVRWLGAHGNYPEDDHDDTEAFQRAVNMVAKSKCADTQKGIKVQCN